MPVVDSRLDKAPGSEPVYRWLRTNLDPRQAPARELAAPDHERREIEAALDGWKTHWRGARIVLRSKRPEWIGQEFRGLLRAHFAIGGLMQEAAVKVDENPGRLSFLPAVRLLRRRLAPCAAIPSPQEESPE
ncbi:MAG: hypothetical protein ACUVS7_10955 [Bryobacteraceae bacterium]